MRDAARHLRSGRRNYPIKKITDLLVSGKRITGIIFINRQNFLILQVPFGILLFLDPPRADGTPARR
ncbi:MAG: hypothetical protein JSW39_04830 [Desulfobacterales bacterium]|nr:MAG: hypothetical protein JSW39_04830 [Desulfobacterales bacterium]